MFKNRTLFIVGAGASAEFNMPQGGGLASLIGNKTNVIDWTAHAPRLNDKELGNQLLRADRNEIHKLLEAAQIISDGVQFSSSIDDFLDIHSGNEAVNTVGKIAIAKTILEQEQSSKLYFFQENGLNRLQVSDFENTWLIKFIRILGRGVTKDDLVDIFKNVAFIVFNYDRCIEHGLYHALQQLYSIQAKEAAKILSTLEIIHPYGKVGDLKTETNEGGVPFGGEPGRINKDYVTISRDIRTYTEQILDTVDLAAIHRQLHLANQIVFLGFAFHPQNVALLKPNDPIERKRIYGTAFNMSDSDVNIVKAQLNRFFPRRMQPIGASYLDIQNLECAPFFDQYGRSLAG